jgi:hypothetical protein
MKALTLKMPFIADASDYISKMEIDSFPSVFFIDKRNIVRFVREAIPVKSGGDGTVLQEGDDFMYDIIDTHSRTIEKLLRK